MEDPESAVTMKMLPSLAFVPEHDVSDCFLILMADFPFLVDIMKNQQIIENL